MGTPIGTVVSGVLGELNFSTTREDLGSVGAVPWPAVNVFVFQYIVTAVKCSGAVVAFGLRALSVR